MALTTTFQLILIGSIRCQPDSIKSFANEIVNLNEQMSKVFFQTSGLVIKMKKDLNHITIINDTFGNISNAWTSKHKFEFKHGVISHASYSISKAEDYEYFSVSGFDIEFVAEDSIEVIAVDIDCNLYTDVTWHNETYPIRVSKNNELVALIHKDSFEVLNKDLFKEEDYATIVAALKAQRYFKDKFIH